MSVIGPDGTVWPANSLRGLEHKSIRDFVQLAADEGYLHGTVLDFGAGKQPYRDIVEGVKPFGGPLYQAFDQADFPANVSGENIGEGDPLAMSGWGTILCTQVMQYVPEPQPLLLRFRGALQEGGHLVMTYATNWPEVEPQDLHRFTKSGMERLLIEAGFEIVVHEWRATAAVALSGESFATGYGVIARA